MRCLRGVVAAAIFALPVLVACGSDDVATGESELKSFPSRDWDKHPAIVEIDEADEIYAVSDPHGAYEPLVRLLEGNKLVDKFDSNPTKVRWTGGKAILVVAGDLIDKGPQSLEVIDLLRSLEKSARDDGGRVVTLIGNHEAEFFADPKNDKAESNEHEAIGINVQLDAAGIKPRDVAMAKDREGRGRWLYDLPLGVRIKKWFFAHGGNTDGKSIEDLNESFEKEIKKNGFADKDIIGKHSILEAEEWYGNPDKGTAKDFADKLGVNHIAFGHDPGALDARGRIAASKDGTLVKLDTTLGRQVNGAEGQGYLLLVHTKGTDTAETLDPSGKSEPLF